MNLSKILESVVKLPPTPQILPKLQALLRNPNSSMDDIVTLLKVDAPMTAQILRISNSAFYAAEERCEHLDEAINRIGFRKVFQVASTAAANQVLGESIVTYRLGKGELMNHAVATALTMGELGGRDVRLNADTVFTTGLLHSIGKVIINQYLLKFNMEIYTPENEEELTVERERVVLGFDHAEAGAELLKKWNFKEEAYEPIRWQFAPEKAGPFVVASSLLYLARESSTYVVAGQIPLAEELERFAPQLDALQLKASDLAEAVDLAIHGFREVQNAVA